MSIKHVFFLQNAVMEWIFYTSGHGYSHGNKYGELTKGEVMQNFGQVLFVSKQTGHEVPSI